MPRLSRSSQSFCACADEPPALAGGSHDQGGSKTLVITLGHKGKFIGVVGVYKTGNPANPCIPL